VARVSEIGPSETKVREIAETVRRVVAARVSNPETVDDVVQETLARVIEARKPLIGEARIAYAIVVARNLVADLARHNERVRSNRHRLIDLRDPESPEEAVLRAEENRALETALKRMPESDRRAFIEHEVMDVETARIARELKSTPGGVATRLARTRAKLRVEYLLALRGVELPTAKCRPVLIALSAGDARRQAALDSGRHLLECSTCASLSPSLLERRRALAGLLPVAALARWGSAAKSWMATTTGKVVGTTAVMGAGAAIVVANLGGEPQPEPKPPPPPIVTVSGDQAVRPAGPGSLDRFKGTRVRARGAIVRRVLSDEGFWVASGNDTVMWVALNAHGESGVEIDRGDRVQFSGVVRSNSAKFVADQRLDGGDRKRLTSQGYHIVVAADEIQTLSD
jgi:RNA polymerase sigma factor (sigma-70 family)